MWEILDVFCICFVVGDFIFDCNVPGVEVSDIEGIERIVHDLIEIGHFD